MCVCGRLDLWFWASHLCGDADSSSECMWVAGGSISGVGDEDGTASMSGVGHEH